MAFVRTSEEFYAKYQPQQGHYNHYPQAEQMESVNVNGVTYNGKPTKPIMEGTVLKDIRAFIIENRALLYWLTLLFILDHLVFEGAFKDRLKVIVEGIIKKVEPNASA